MKINTTYKKLNKQAGQSMTEYLIILGLIAVTSIAVFSFFGTSLRSQIAGMANEITGTSAAGNIATGQGAAGQATTNSSVNRTMGTYNEGATDALK